ncbi:MAG TPA: hypothetical protein VFD70_12840 [Anaerolineae bacterium]|nr:hypothetical protein [Anaerolineae bacterium]
MDVTLPHNFDEADAPEVLEEARPVLDLPSDAQLRVENVRKTSRGTDIEFTYTSYVEIDDGELRAVAGVRVQVSAHGDLRFDSKGELVAHEVEPPDPQVRAIRDQLAKLIASGQVYVAKPGEKVDPDKLRAMGKSWYVEEDEDGNKHLRRAWIS